MQHILAGLVCIGWVTLVFIPLLWAWFIMDLAFSNKISDVWVPILIIGGFAFFVGIMSSITGGSV